AGEQRAYRADSGAPKARTDGLQQSRTDTRQSRVGTDVDGEDPAAGRRAEFPIANFADHEADDVAVGVRHHEFPPVPCPIPVPSINRAPVAALFQPGHRRVDRDDLIEISALYGTDRE